MIDDDDDDFFTSKNIHNDQIWVLTERSQKSLHLKNKWTIWDHETKTYETEAETKTNDCQSETETETKKS